jgi:hypothetical protein
LNIPSGVKARAAKSLKAAADWAVRNQIRHIWPRWNANAGRFPYHVYLPTDDFYYSTSWNTARAIQGMLSAWETLRNTEYLCAAERGLEYIKSLQIFSPENPRLRGCFIEETPVNDHAGSRDGIECSQALISHYLATKNPVSLNRAEAFFDWMLNWMRSDLYPCSYIYFKPEWKPTEGGDAIEYLAAAAAIPLVQMAKIKKDKKYITRGAAPLIDVIVRNFQRPDGSLGWKKAGNIVADVIGDSAIDNDDGIGVAILSAWKGTGKNKYLDSATALGDWWLKQDISSTVKHYAALPCIVLLMADLARATGKKDYVQFILDHSGDLFKLQIQRDERPLVSGAFRGEDMSETYRPGSNPGQYICLRTTSYGLMTLSKLAAQNAKEWGPSYSAFGF